MKIAGITRVRNEEVLLQDTLDYYAKWCDAIFVYDDASSDDTPLIYGKHPAVENFIRNTSWMKDRERAEWSSRDEILRMAKLYNPEWILYFDADERIEWDFKGYEDYDAVRMKLFDFYITPKDLDRPWDERRFLGPEYRLITMFYRNTPTLSYGPNTHREMFGAGPRVLQAGHVRHYGKAMSIEQWEETCRYYMNHYGEPYISKWRDRIGKAVHVVSDFGNPLITWDQKEQLGILLNE